MASKFLLTMKLTKQGDHASNLARYLGAVDASVYLVVAAKLRQLLAI